MPTPAPDAGAIFTAVSIFCKANLHTVKNDLFKNGHNCVSRCYSEM